MTSKQGLRIGSTSCTLSQWQVLSTQLQQQAAAACSRWRCAGANRGLLPDLGKWTTVLASRCAKVARQASPNLTAISLLVQWDLLRRFLFFIYLWMDQCRRKWCFGGRFPPFRSCGARVTSKTRFLVLCKSTWRKNWNMTHSFWWVTKSIVHHRKTLRFWARPNMIRPRAPFVSEAERNRCLPAMPESQCGWILEAEPCCKKNRP